MSQQIGNAFKSRIPTFSDDASIQEAFSVYHYGKDNYSTGQEVEENSIEGHFVTANSRIGALEVVVDNLSDDYVLKISPVAKPNILTTQDGGTTVPLTIRGTSGQTEPLQQWQNSTTTRVSGIFNDGGAVFGNYLTVGNTSKSSSTALDVRIGNSAHKGITVAGVVSQSGNLQEWTSTNGSTTSVVARVASNGKIFSNSGLTGTNTSEVVTETGTQTITNKTLTAPTVNGGNSNDVRFARPTESVSVSATAASGTINYDCSSYTVLYYNANATGNWTLNFRGNSSTTLNSILATGQSISAIHLVQNGGVGYIPSTIQIDGTNRTVLWANATAPFASPNGTLSYNFTIIKTGNNVFAVFGSWVRLA
jgi:hypothetical protein